MQRHPLTKSLKKTTWAFGNLLPIIIGMLLLTSLAVTLFPEQIAANLFGGNDALDALIGLEMELDPETLIFGIDEAICMAAVAVHIGDAFGNTSVGKKNCYLMN